MITVSEAKKIVTENVEALPVVSLLLAKAAGMVLGKDVFATIDIPAFNQSSMDGYALSWQGLQQHHTLKIAGEMAAGSNEAIAIKPGEAVRIFTGAAVPAGADTVVMQEKVKRENGILIIEDEKIQAGNNVRLKGSEIKAGALALPKGTILSPAAIGFLAGTGIAEVPVISKPRVHIIVTGKELQQPGKPLEYGQVYESNSLTLAAVLQQAGITDIKTVQVDDDIDIVKQKLEAALNESDLILFTGGISVGDYDFVLQATEQCGVRKLFHRIKQRPGKPLYFGKKENKTIFGLPGNPSSVLTCFYEYVIPAICKMMGKENIIKKETVPLGKTIQKISGLTQFLKGYYDGKTATALDAQESYRLSSFARANCLIQVEEEITECLQGTLVEIHHLPAN